MAKIDQDEKMKIKELLSENLKNDVNLLFFSKDDDCQYCGDTEEILEEVTGLDDRVNFETHKLGSEKAEEYAVDKAPAIIFLNEDDNDSGLRFNGIPSGYEFTSLIEDILDASDKERIDLSDDIKAEVKALENEVTLQVFITPTCPYCPRAVRVAHQMALLNPNIRGEMVEAIEFEELSASYNVSGVPKTVINHGADEQVGAVPAKTILSKIQNLPEDVAVASE